MQQDKLKKTLKLAWSNGLSLFMAMAGAILLVFLLFRFDSILGQILRVCNILMPIIMGIVIAYLLNPVVEFYERHLDRSLGKFIEKTAGYEINTLNLRLLDDNRLEDMQRAMVDTDYQKELMKEYGIGK